MQAWSDRRQHAGEDLEPEGLFVAEPIGAARGRVTQGGVHARWLPKLLAGELRLKDAERVKGDAGG